MKQADLIEKDRNIIYALIVKDKRQMSCKIYKFSTIEERFIAILSMKLLKKKYVGWPNETEIHKIKMIQTDDEGLTLSFKNNEQRRDYVDFITGYTLEEDKEPV